MVLHGTNSIKNSIYLLRHRCNELSNWPLEKSIFSFLLRCWIEMRLEFWFLFLALSATKVNRRPGTMHPTLRRQPGVRSTSNLRMHEATSAGSRMVSSEAPEMRSGGATSAGSHRTPSYMKSTTASSKKFKSQNSNENQGPISGPQRMTGVHHKQNRYFDIFIGS